MLPRRYSRGLALSLSAFVAFDLCIIAVCGLHAQVVGGTLSGTVTDTSEAVIPNGHISIKNVATGITRDVTTDAGGFYTAPNLLPGTYQVTASAPGFATEVRTVITLTVGGEQVLNLTMRLGKVSERVQVVGMAPAVQLTSSAI